MNTTFDAAFAAEEIEPTIAPGLCSEILSAAEDAGSIRSGILGVATLGAWGWTLLVCTAGQ